MSLGVLLDAALVAAVTKQMKTAPSGPAGLMDQTQTALFTGRQVPLHDLRSPQWFQERLPHSQRLSCCRLTDQSLNNLIVCFKIILCNAPRMSELLCELTSLHIFQLISGNLDRQGP